MNKQQKELHQISLNSEKDVLKRLTENYQDALDEIKTRIAILQMREDADLQHVIYQVEYQKQLKSQVENILEQLKNNNFESISEYLTQCYEQGFIGTLYDIQGQGVPLVFPIDQEMVVEAIQHETQLSESLYMALGKDTKELSKQIASEISRGITNGSMYSEIARNLSGYAGISKNNAMRIARTEGHRIQNKAIAHAQEKARDRGADIVKIWDAALDGKTRPHHRELDGQIRELDEPFEIAGMTAQEPGGFGRPEEDINCRCRRISKARWLLDAEETKYIGNTEKMSDEDLEPIANKLNITVEDLRQHSDEIIPVRARNYQDFKRQYDNINNYRNTDAYKEAQERIAGYGNGNSQEKGLGANNKFNGILPHKEPEIINNIDFNDEEAVLSVIRKFEKEAIGEKIETACVITTDGTVYKCYGVNDRCFIDSDLGDKLIGSKATHNHPIEATHYSFSSDDRTIFTDYKMEFLRGFDEKYTYEFNRNSSDIDEHMSIFDMDPEIDGEHENCITKAEQFGFGYHRWKND